MKKIKTGYLLVGTFLVLVVLLFVSNYLNDTNEAVLTENGIETMAKITKIDVNNYRMNEMDGTTVENYILTLNFLVDGKTIKSIRTIEKKTYAKFFNKALHVNDSISILYDPSNPKNNKIKELTESSEKL
ncbi:MAG: hypothetical protein JKY02_07300 [Flavobacteriaceae bacterium]|nr:hypothetical protein [Flavobacteriaceae bacterium]